MDKVVFDELVEVRRSIHAHPELGLDLPHTRQVIEEFLTRKGIPYEEFEGAVIVRLGNTGPLAMFRADMDALPLTEDSGLSFSAKGNIAHCCGHDLHATMLLGAIAEIKNQGLEKDRNLMFVFQPDEEGGTGAKNLVSKGLFAKYGKPEYCFAIHVDAKQPLGVLNYGSGRTFAANDALSIRVKGKGGHGARSFEGIDPIFVANSIYTNLNVMISREFNVFEHNILSITAFNTKESYNIIPDSAIMMGTLRTYSSQERERVVERLTQVCTAIGEALRANVEIEFLKHIPSVITDIKMTNLLVDHFKQEKVFTQVAEEPVVKIGSEDFAYYTQTVARNVYCFIGAGPDETTPWRVGQHNPQVVFNENVIPYGVNFFLHTVKLLPKFD